MSNPTSTVLDRPAAPAASTSAPKHNVATSQKKITTQLLGLIVTFFALIASKLEASYERMYADWTSLLASAGTSFGSLAKAFEIRKVTRHEIGVVYTKAANYIGQAAQAVLATLETPLFGKSVTKQDRLHIATALMSSAEQVRQSAQFADWDQNGENCEKAAKAFERAAELIMVDNVDRNELGEALNVASQALRGQAIQISRGFQAAEVVNAVRYSDCGSDRSDEPTWQHDQGAGIRA